ncbi:TlyA family RNA methyltransferase [Patescibacteria group bacterium]|nr:TlyA family RNA methyltransferase [Patescibacteria group bacterium]MCL5410167.1 TlyA family RNA methyltransferase [Patescibacteria group bacterium]
MEQNRFVSRGGLKLQAALDKFQLSPAKKTVLDVGSSTGGFVDCLLQNGAQKVYALDTAYGELAWKLRQNPQVVVMERTNILHLASLPEKVDLVTIDAGWTKLELVLPVVKKFLQPDGQIIALLKPHYELPQATKKGLVPADQVGEIKQQVLNNLEALNFKILQVIDSPILGGAGNQEFLVLLKVV